MYGLACAVVDLYPHICQSSHKLPVWQNLLCHPLQLMGKATDRQKGRLPGTALGVASQVLTVARHDDGQINKE